MAAEARRRMVIWTCALPVALLATAVMAVSESPGERMYARLKGLAGEWEGTYEWSAGRTGSGPIRITYSLTANGFAVVEDLFQGGVRTMTSVYHLDGTTLRMTHYCLSGTQPRLAATRVDEATGTVELTLVDVTHSGAGHHGHVQRASLQLLDDERLHLRYDFGGSSAAGVENILVRRVQPAASPS